MAALRILVVVCTLTQLTAVLGAFTPGVIEDVLHRVKDTRVTSGCNSATVEGVRSALACAAKCVEVRWCFSVNFHAGNGTCELTCVFAHVDSTQKTPDVGWTWMYREG
jgi:hypothetical protein